MTRVPLATRLGRGAAVALATGLAYLVPSVVVIGVLWRRLRRDEQRVVGLLAAVAAAQLVYCAYVGGDAWEYMDLACYPEMYSGAAYRMGLNFMIYAMTH